MHEFSICIIETVGFDDANGGDDTIYGSPFNDILFGGGGDDVIYGYERRRPDLRRPGQGHVRARHARTTPDDPRNGVCVDLGGAIVFIATNTTTNTGSGNDLIYAGDGQRHRHGPAGQRRHLRRATATTS